MENKAEIKQFLPKSTEISLDETSYFSSPLYWGVSDTKRFNELIEEMKTLVSPGYFFGDNLFTWTRNLSALEDVPFRNAWHNNLANTADETIVWRRYILACAGYHCIQLEGDFVECGVYVGTGIKTVVDYLGGEKFPKTFWGYDTYDYNPVEGHEFEGQTEGFYEKVCTRFQKYKQVKLIKGLLPNSLQGNEPEKIAYLHIDMNNFEGEIAVLDALFERVVPGGMIILDDYEWSGIYRPQKLAEDKWFDERSYKVFPLPTGQGFVIKR